MRKTSRLFILVSLSLMGCGQFVGEVSQLTEEASLASCPEDSLTTGPCQVPTAGKIVTEDFGSDITTWNNPSFSTTVSGSIPNGYYFGKIISFSDPELIAGNIRLGFNIFGVEGTFQGTGDYAQNMASTIHRDKTEPQITLHDEAVVNTGVSYTNADPGYRVVPQISKDDEGQLGGSVTYVNRTSPAWAARTCGLVGTVEDRITSCNTEFGADATWDGATKGNSAQGAWKLVSRTGGIVSSKGREVWRDERTKLLWSSKVTTSLNWCKASGSNFITSNPVAENDPFDYCDNVTYQTVGTSPTDKAVSACFEDGDNAFHSIDAGIDNQGKVNLGLASTPVVAWRLPTKWDYHMAETNGIRFVLPDMGAISGSYEWSSSVMSGSRGLAWVFNGTSGNVTTNPRTTVYSVRCVGR